MFALSYIICKGYRENVAVGTPPAGTSGVVTARDRNIKWAKKVAVIEMVTAVVIPLIAVLSTAFAVFLLPPGLGGWVFGGGGLLIGALMCPSVINLLLGTGVMLDPWK